MNYHILYNDKRGGKNEQKEFGYGGDTNIIISLLIPNYFGI